WIAAEKTAKAATNASRRAKLGVKRAKRNPRAIAEERGACSGSGRSRLRPTKATARITPLKEAAFTPNATAAPNVANTTPASAGPTARAPLEPGEVRANADGRLPRRHRRPERGEHDTGERRPDGAGDVEAGRVERHR